MGELLGCKRAASDIVYEILPRADGRSGSPTEGGLFRGTRRQLGILWKKVAGTGLVSRCIVSGGSRRGSMDRY